MRILLVADDPLARAGLSALLAQEDEIEIAMQFASDDPGLLDAPAIYTPEAVLWDVGWEAVDDFEGLAEFVEIGPPVVVLVPDAQLARDKAMQEADLAERKFEQEAIMAERQMAINAQMQEKKQDADIKMKKNRPGGDLDK